MTITESKIKTGSLKFTIAPAAAVDFSCQPTNVRITPSYDSSGDPVETLCGDTLAEDESRSDALNITAIQDFTDPDGFIKWAWDNDLAVAAFEWKPTGVTGPTFTGSVKVKAPEVGGDVNKRLTSDLEWSVVGAVTWTPAP